VSVPVTIGNKSQNSLSVLLFWQSPKPSINITSANSQKYDNETDAVFKAQASLDSFITAVGIIAIVSNSNQDNIGFYLWNHYQ
jgi:hypothetical protein